MSDEFLVLAVETSCDETAAAVTMGRRVLSNIISSQIGEHAIYGGVVPEIASRRHTEAISAVVDEALLAAGVKMTDIGLYAVTCGPGLAGALIVGVSYAKALSFAMNKPLVGVNHIEGHICSNYIDNSFEPPYLCLVVSGGHTHLVLVKDYRSYDVLGKTRDDAAGEAFDKVARALGLPYPGGPQIDKLARSGDPYAISFPRAHSANDFSFSGLKSAVLNYLNKNKNNVNAADVAASFQQAVVDVLVNKTVDAAGSLNMDTIALAGGVSANRCLREKFSKHCAEKGYKLNLPEMVYCTDNAAMIGVCGYYRYINGEKSGLSLNAYPDMKFERTDAYGR